MDWVDIGGLLSEFRYYSFNRLRVKTFTVGDLLTLSKIVQTRSVLGMIDFIDSHIDQDVNELLDIDFYYVMFWLKKQSYPDSTMTLTWDCTNWNVHEAGKPRVIINDPNIVGMSTPSLNYFGYERSRCGYKNTEIVYKIDTQFRTMPDTIVLPKGYRFPRVRTMGEAEFVRDTGMYDNLIEYFRWLDYDSIHEAIENFDWEGDADETMQKIDRLMAQHDYSIKTAYKLRCSSCHTVHDIKRIPDLFAIFPLIDSQAVMDMQYNLMGQFNVAINPDTDARSLLYWHSNYVKDRQRAKEEAAKAKAVKGKSLR